jgi:hypothetical protein
MERNTIEIEIPSDEIVDGKKVSKRIGFKCGNLAIAIACREAGAKSVQDLLVMLANQDLMANLALLYGSHIQFSGKKDFTMDMMSDITEQMTEEQSEAVATKLLERFIPKNAKAPETTGASQ